MTRMIVQIVLILLAALINGMLQIAAGQRTRYMYTTFQAGVICDAAQEPLQPTTLIEIQAIVLMALNNNSTLKALGRGHSGTDIICTDGIPVNLQRINSFKYDPDTEVATVGAGSTMESFLERLHENGRTVYGVPTYPGITVGGLIGTGAHGTSFEKPASLSDQVVRVVVVDGLGKVRNISDRETLRAFRAHLGLLGILYEITVSTIPQHKLHIQNYPVPDSILWNGNEILNLAKSAERLQFFWFPTAKSVIMSVGHRVPLSTQGNCQTYFITEGSHSIIQPLAEALEEMQIGRDHLGYFTIQNLVKLSMYQKVPGRSPIFTADGKTLCDPAIGFSHRMSGNRCIECPWQHGNDSLYEFEYAAVIPLTELQGAINTIRTILNEFPIEFPLTGIYFRFLPASDGLLTINSDRPSVVIEWVIVPRKDRFNKPSLGLSSSQAMLQALISKHGGRGHWGKNGALYTQKPILLEKYPHLPTFIRRMEEFDPRGVFLNDFGRRLRFGTKKSSMDSYAEHCGLVDNCICQNNNDCGDGSPGSYLCDVIQNYRVCKENPEGYDAFRARIVRKLVSTLKQR